MTVTAGGIKSIKMPKLVSSGPADPFNFMEGVYINGSGVPVDGSSVLSFTIDAPLAGPEVKFFGRYGTRVSVQCQDCEVINI